MTTPDWHEETLARQLAMTPQTWATLRAHGVDESTLLRLDFSYVAGSEAQADELAAFLRLQTDYAVEVEFSRPGGEVDGGPGTAGTWVAGGSAAGVEDDRTWSVVGQTHPTAVSEDILKEWVAWMVAAGAEYGQCQFDGWGAGVGG